MLRYVGKRFLVGLACASIIVIFALAEWLEVGRQRRECALHEEVLKVEQKAHEERAEILTEIRALRAELKR
jgi:hypothetical protein